MAEIYSFFDSMPDENGQKDREYNAQEFTDYFGDLVTTGIMKGANAELKVMANGSNMITEIDTGIAFVEGKRYANTAKKSHTHDTETLGKDRIDRIVIRKDLNTDARHVKSFIKKGIASANPVPPALTRNEMVYEISLAQVKIIGGQTYISAGNVTDERGKPDVCPWAGSNILPNISGVEDLLEMDGPYSLTLQPAATGTILCGKYKNGLVWISTQFWHFTIPEGGLLATLPPGFAPKEMIPFLLILGNKEPYVLGQKGLLIRPDGKIVLGAGTSYPNPGTPWIPRGEIVFLANPVS